jgi:hypothetical protein
MTSSAFASSNAYDLKMDLSLNGKHLSSPRVIVKEGEVATITQKTESEENFIEVTATENMVMHHRGIKMNFTVGTIAKDGKRIVASKPQVLVEENKPAQLMMNGGSAQLSLSVVAQRKEM